MYIWQNNSYRFPLRTTPSVAMAREPTLQSKGPDSTLDSRPLMQQRSSRFPPHYSNATISLWDLSCLAGFAARGVNTPPLLQRPEQYLLALGKLASREDFAARSRQMSLCPGTDVHCVFNNIVLSFNYDSQQWSLFFLGTSEASLTDSLQGDISHTWQ